MTSTYLGRAGHTCSRAVGSDPWRDRRVMRMTMIQEVTFPLVSVTLLGH